MRKVAKLTLIDCNQIVITIAFDGRIHLITLQTYKRLLS
ncbi:malate dehydrogenase, partial [Vibrio cholerae]|nr:malate dehydrogenase [Vibrio cholerae]